MPIQRSKPKNRLLVYRKRLGFSQKQVAHLLGQADTSMISRYERGGSAPTLTGALQLEIICRAPVAFLFRELYEELRQEIRKEEERLAGRGQQQLFRRIQHENQTK